MDYYRGQYFCDMQGITEICDNIVSQRFGAILVVCEIT